MADTLQFELVAPERLIFSGDVEMVVVPGAEGDFGVLPGHSLLLSTLRPGVIEIYENEKPKDRYVVAEGFAEVTGERCTVLSTEAFEAGAHRPRPGRRAAGAGAAPAQGRRGRRGAREVRARGRARGASGRQRRLSSREREFLQNEANFA